MDILNLRIVVSNRQLDMSLVFIEAVQRESKKLRVEVIFKTPRLKIILEWVHGKKKRKKFEGQNPELQM